MGYIKHGKFFPVSATYCYSNDISPTSYMGADEMRQINSDSWDAELWGAAHDSPTGIPRPKMYFYFGTNDHWVADRTRDDLMMLRGRADEDEVWKPKMEIDKLGIPHAFPDGEFPGFLQII
jgi:hypothetical protein